MYFYKSGRSGHTLNVQAAIETVLVASKKSYVFRAADRKKTYGTTILVALLTEISISNEIRTFPCRPPPQNPSRFKEHIANQ